MTPTSMAYRTDVPADKAAVLVAVAGLAEVLAVACPRAVVASTRRRGERPSVVCVKPCTQAWFILASGIW